MSGWRFWELSLNKTKNYIVWAGKFSLLSCCSLKRFLPVESDLFGNFFGENCELIIFALFETLRRLIDLFSQNILLPQQNNRKNFLKEIYKVSGFFLTLREKALDSVSKLISTCPGEHFGNFSEIKISINTLFDVWAKSLWSLSGKFSAALSELHLTCLEEHLGFFKKKWFFWHVYQKIFRLSA